MKEEKSYRLSFRIWHPLKSATEIIENFSMSVNHCFSYGEQRKTKSGELLEGNYDHTWISFKLHEKPLEFDSVCFERYLQQQLSNVDFKYTSRLVEEGAKCEFVIGVFTNDNVMFELDTETIKLLDKAGIGLSFYVYGGD